MSIELRMLSNHLIFYCPLLFLFSIFPSIRIFSNDLAFPIRWPEYWSFSFIFSLSNEYSGLISFSIDWFDLTSQGILKSILQHHNLKPSILQHLAFIMDQLSHPYMTTGKTITLTRWTFVSKVISWLFNTLSWFIITFLLKSKCISILWLQSPFTVVLEPKKIKSVTVSTFSPPICCEVMRPDVMILVFWILSFKHAFSLSSFSFIKRLFSFSFLSAIRVLSSVYLRLLILLSAISIPAFDSSSPEFHIMYFA